ncbi:uncharacterized protein LOC126293682 isoform X2 [Schistocerca gregaria]|uniref:uncharacterized protein LOC126293682 isoform X2 n=1 Tax=Schistocerca gregaria TaxID=7010 RepID=UPI00211F2457|nr:uncharacterized protein LOC126293682 isoform X2 [Schistocerca gregaria]
MSYGCVSLGWYGVSSGAVGWRAVSLLLRVVLDGAEASGRTQASAVRCAEVLGSGSASCGVSQVSRYWRLIHYYKLQLQSRH